MSRDMLLLNRPTSWEKDMWKEALPIGCGIMGGLVFGAIEKEQIIITRHDLWHKRKNVMPLPCITESFNNMRKAMDEGYYIEACHMMENSLREKGYGNSSDPTAFPLGSLKLSYVTDGVTFRRYRRGIDMKKAISFVRWEDGNGKTERECFISRDNGILYYRIKANFEAVYDIDFDFYDNLDYASKAERELRCEKLKKEVSDNKIFYSTNTDGEDFGALIVTEAIDGTVEKKGDCLHFSGKELVIKLSSFAKTDRDFAESELFNNMENSDCFDEALEKHEKKHRMLYDDVSVSLVKVDDKSLSLTNRELLDIAYDDEAPDALIEKLWRFGRYLFISAMHEKANPFPLYGLWPGAYNLPWTAHVCNENVQCMYWHTLSGGLSQSIKNLIHYYYKKIPSMKENAKKLFGCRGIFVPTYTYPETMDGVDSAPPYPIVPVSLNWISGGAWLSKHFYDYYVYTKDSETLKNEILPFMIEVARFYEDYITYDENGKMKIYPSVSPENSPGNLSSEGVQALGHACPAVENATMDFAIMKMHFKNLLFLVKSDESYGDSIKKWENILSKIPEYEINEDGAVTEWMADSLSDNYDHRHFSHLFPIFPGEEVTKENDAVLYEAFRKAANLRIPGAMSGWSFPHLGLIHTRFGEGNEALNKIITMAKGIVLDNFFTLHNDWRHMGMGINVDYMAPVQLDALMGTVALVQDMLFRYNDGTLKILPALPDRMKYVKVEGMYFPDGKVSFTLNDGELYIEIKVTKDIKLTVNVFGEKRAIDCKKDEPFIIEIKK